MTTIFICIMLILILVLFLFLWKKFYFKKSSSEKSDNKKLSCGEDQKLILDPNIIYPPNLSKSEYILFTKLYRNFYYSTYSVPLPVIWAILWTESGCYIVDGIPNSEVIGDDGKSIGYFQIYVNGALKDYNQTFNKNYTLNDLKDYNINKTIGIWYIEKCYKLALKQANKKPVEWLTFKKYNGGVDETETSKNTKATNYANKTFERYRLLNIFYKLNLSS